jgi:hypothetical protein
VIDAGLPVQSQNRKTELIGWAVMLALMCMTVLIYTPGLSGGYFFDDYPNIVDNPAIRVAHVDIPSLVRSALSSPSSEFRRPIASLSFSMNYLIGGSDPLGMKVTNLVVHLINGLLVFMLLRRLLAALGSPPQRTPIVAAMIASGWMLLPINLTAVLYTVQRMESLANLFVLLGLFGYVGARIRMQQRASRADLWMAVLALALATPVGLLAKETAALLPLYAFIIECTVFRWKSAGHGKAGHVDMRLVVAFAILLALPLVAGLAWLLPGLLQPQAWASREFTLGTRLLSEARIVCDYIIWTLVPTSSGLAFYHDDFVISSGWLSPWTTTASALVLTALIGLAILLRKRMPGFTLGILLFFGAQTLASTILPLELVYEHRNYFASLGLLIALACPLSLHWERLSVAGKGIRAATAAVALVCWTFVTADTAYAWGSPLRLAQELARRGPDSPRAQYELGRAYIIASGYRTESPFTDLSYAPLEHAASLPNSGILPEQALIFLNARLHRPVKTEWWESIDAKLRANEVKVQDESALSSLVQCKQTTLCDLPNDRLLNAYTAALSHPSPSARLLATYGDFAWTSLRDRALAQRMLEAAVKAKPEEPAYRLTLARMAIDNGDFDLAREQRSVLSNLNVGGSLAADIAAIDRALNKQ